MPAASVIAALLLAVLASPASASWRPPVDGALARRFAVTTNPFAAGQHRGIDLRARPGTSVRAPCGGRVVVAGRVGTSGGVVTLRCGRWRVTHLPLATIAVHAGTSVARGARLGTVARGAGHIGLHLGVRREAKRFGYVDPLRFLTLTPTTPLPPLGRAPRGDRKLPPSPRPPRASAPATAPLARPTTAPLARPAMAPLARPATAPLATPLTAPLAAPHLARFALGAGAGRGGLAPWPAWLGLALVLAGIGVRRRGTLRTRTRRRVRASVRLNE
jgi:hypothetical protein